MKLLLQVASRQRGRRLARALESRCNASGVTTAASPALHNILVALPASTRPFSSAPAGFRCSDCGASYSKWQGQCGSCNAWGTVAPATHAAPLYRQSNAASFAHGHKKPKHHAHSVAWTGAPSSSDEREKLVLRMNDVQGEAITERIKLPERELNWVLGGGLVPGSLTLVAGNPGVGKSTLALQVANMLAHGSTAVDAGRPATAARDVLYVSGEESALQVKMRADRLGAVSDGLFVASETNIDDILRMIERHAATATDNGGSSSSSVRGFTAVVIDSIQTVYADDVASAAGSVNQVKECTLRLLRLAKQRNVPVIVIGHVTKSGDIAGPKVLEHIVDTVVQLDGDPQSARRFLRCQKNRFGNTSEVAVLSMTDAGLQPLTNPLLAFVSSAAGGRALLGSNSDGYGRDGADEDDDDDDDGDAASLDGSSITIAMEGTRPIPLEIQALANRLYVSGDGKSSGGASFSRVRGVGVAFDKLQLLFAVMEKRAKLSFQHQSVFVNVAEGYTIQEPAADLALAVALASSVLGRAVIPRAVFLGEIALSGHLRPVKMLEARLAAAAKIGIDVCVVPRVHDHETQQALRKFDGRVRVVEASTLLQALKIALQAADGDSKSDDGDASEAAGDR